MDQNLLKRSELMGATASHALRDATRMAILRQLDASGGDPAQFRPAEHAEDIKKRLGSWGVPVNRARPEIDSILSQSFGPDELNLWVREASFTHAEREQISDDLLHRAKASADATQSAGIRP